MAKTPDFTLVFPDGSVCIRLNRNPSLQSPFVGVFLFNLFPIATLGIVGGPHKATDEFIITSLSLSLFFFCNSDLKYNENGKTSYGSEYV